MIADHFVHRHKQLDVNALYDPSGVYQFTNGFSLVALAALALSALPNLPGFLVALKVLNVTQVPVFLLGLYNYAWFAGFGLAFVLYFGLRRIWPQA